MMPSNVATSFLSYFNRCIRILGAPLYIDGSLPTNPVKFNG